MLKHFTAVNDGKVELKEKKRWLAQLDQMSQSDSDTDCGQQTLAQAFSKGTKSGCDAAVGRFFYAEGVPMQKISSPYTYFAEMCKAIGQFGASYHPPTRQRLATDMLEKEHAAVQDSLSSYMSTLPHAGTVTSDGWQDARSRPSAQHSSGHMQGQLLPAGSRHIWQGQARLAVLS